MKTTVTGRTPSSPELQHNTRQPAPMPETTIIEVGYSELEARVAAALVDAAAFSDPGELGEVNGEAPADYYARCKE